MPEVYSSKRKTGKKKKVVMVRKMKRKRKIEKVVVDEVKQMNKEGGFDNLWRSLVAYPRKTSFEFQNEGEVIMLLMRRHLVTNLGWGLASLVLLFIPFFWGEFPLLMAVNEKVGFGITVLWYTGLLLYVLQNLLLWFYNVYIVTDERVIDVDFFGLLYKNVNVAQLKNIEDVSYSQIGILSSIFNYGKVIVQTASEQLSDDVGQESAAFTFNAVPNPDRVIRVINQLMEQEELESYEGRVK